MPFSQFDTIYRILKDTHSISNVDEGQASSGAYKDMCRQRVKLTTKPTFKRQRVSSSNKISFTSLGCSKALVDSEQTINKLIAEGYEIINDQKNANLVIINTCAFINEAIAESLDTIGKAFKNNNNIIVMGCLGAKASIIKSSYPKVLAIIPPDESQMLLQKVHEYLPIEIKKNRQSQNIKLTPKHYSYLKISEGCNQHCTYCIIPTLRGKLKSKPIKEILNEAEKLVSHGNKELIIIAQDTLAYGTDLPNQKSKIMNLLNSLSKLGVWIRLHYLYPYPFIDKIILQMAANKILPYLDVPLQHINKNILKKMRRPFASENMLNKITKWRSICPDLVIRSTFIVGFPGETENDFNELLNFLKIAELDHVGCFKFSEVQGAKANKFNNKISEEIKNERYNKLMTIQQKISKKKLKARIGTTMKVLIDKQKDGIAIGRGYIDSPEIDGQVFISSNKKLQVGNFVNVKITKTTEYDLYGTVVI